MELQLLQKLFAPEEATLAAAMSQAPTPLSEIVAYTGVDPDVATQLVTGMAGRGLIRVQEREGEHYCGLKPFIVGFYESHLPRMDAEFAELFEQYYQETQGLRAGGGGQILGRARLHLPRSARSDWQGLRPSR